MKFSLNSNTNYPISNREHCISNATTFALGGDPLQAEDKYQLFVTAHFGKPNQLDVHRNCKHFRNVMDRKILRSQKRLFKVLWLEEGKQLQTNIQNTTHAHWLFELPRHLSEQCFKHVFTEIWSDICGSQNVVFKTIELERGGVDGLISYCTKESNSNNHGTFIEQCSDNSRHQSSRQSLRQLRSIQRQTNHGT